MHFTHLNANGLANAIYAVFLFQSKNKKRKHRDESIEHEVKAGLRQAYTGHRITLNNTTISQLDLRCPSCLHSLRVFFVVVLSHSLHPALFSICDRHPLLIVIACVSVAEGRQ